MDELVLMPIFILINIEFTIPLIYHTKRLINYPL